MEFLGRLLIAFFVFIIVEFLSVNIGSTVGAGPNEVGIVVCAISLMCGVMVICTAFIVDAIKKTNQEKATQIGK
ncbi:MAG: hypothetical protein JXQ26_02125 [Tissierellales bacterium]|nr:hypothetical protein [Tissierellales bacterium]